MFLLAQIFGILAWLSLLISYYRKNTDKILTLHILSILFYLLNYLFLGAWSGLFIIVLELTRDSLYYKTDKDNLIFLITIPFYIILFVLSLGSIVELIPIVASLLEGFTLTKKKNIVVPGALIVYTMWIVYDFSVGAYTGALTDALIVFSNIGILINMFKGYKSVNEFRISSRYLLTENTLKIMNELKKDVFAKEILLSDSYEEKLYKKNINNLLFIKTKKELKGYITTIHISKNTFAKIININEIDENYENLILNINSTNEKILLVDSIVLKEKYQNKKAKELIKKYLIKISNSKKFNNFVFIASTDFEKEIVKELCLRELKVLNDKSIIYTKKDI